MCTVNHSFCGSLSFLAFLNLDLNILFRTTVFRTELCVTFSQSESMEWDVPRFVEKLQGLGDDDGFNQF